MLDQVSQLPGFGAGAVNRVISVLGSEKLFHPRNIEDGKLGTIPHTN